MDTLLLVVVQGIGWSGPALTQQIGLLCVELPPSW